MQVKRIFWVHYISRNSSKVSFCFDWESKCRAVLMHWCSLFGWCDT